jgi:hypothetical protein
MAGGLGTAGGRNRAIIAFGVRPQAERDARLALRAECRPKLRRRWAETKPPISPMCQGVPPLQNRQRRTIAGPQFAPSLSPRSPGGARRPMRPPHWMRATAIVPDSWTAVRGGGCMLMQQMLQGSLWGGSALAELAFVVQKTAPVGHSGRLRSLAREPKSKPNSRVKPFVSRSHAMCRCLRMPPDRHPEPGFRWARSAWSWDHLTRDVHAPQEMFHARAQMSIGSRKLQPSMHRRQPHSRRNIKPRPSIGRTC